MANTYSALHYHVVFSTKHRERWITPDIESRIWSYLGGIARDNDMKALCVGGIEDHVHLLLGAPPTIAPAKAAQLIKGGSSKWIPSDVAPRQNASRGLLDTFWGHYFCHHSFVVRVLRVPIE